MRLRWVEYPYGERGGDTLGYAGLIRALRAHLPAVGIELIDRAEDGRFADRTYLHVCSPGVFGRTPEAYKLVRRRGTRHILFTMWESADFIVAPQWGDEGAECGRADLIITPNAWCSGLFHQKTGRPTTTVPLGIRPVPYRERSVPEGGWTAERPFTWLLVGATNPRKGLAQLSGAWMKYFGENSAMRLLIKSTFPESVTRRLTVTGEAPIIASRGNVTHDARMLPRDELDAIYDSADAFIYPTMGEGWGFTLHEAMTAGLPAVATGCQGVLEYASPDTCHLLPWQYRGIGSRDAVKVSSAPDGKFRYCYVEPHVIAQVMIDVMVNYDAAIARARRAAWHARTFTWERTAGVLAGEIATWAAQAA